MDNYLKNTNNELAHVISGDANINILESRKRDNDRLPTLVSHGCTAGIKTPTIVTKNTVSCLEHFLK